MVYINLIYLPVKFSLGRLPMTRCSYLLFRFSRLQFIRHCTSNCFCQQNVSGGCEVIAAESSTVWTWWELVSIYITFQRIVFSNISMTAKVWISHFVLYRPLTAEELASKREAILQRLAARKAAAQLNQTADSGSSNGIVTGELVLLPSSSIPMRK